MTVLVETRADLTLEAARRVAWQRRRTSSSGRGRSRPWPRAGSRLERILDHDSGKHDLWRDDGISAGSPGRNLTPGAARAVGRHVAGPRCDVLGRPAARTRRAGDRPRAADQLRGGPRRGVSGESPREVAAMLGAGRLPAVPAKGQGGAGEILSLSHLFTDLAEKAKPALKDMLCLVNGSPSATGLVTDAALVAEKRFDVATKVLALVLRGVQRAARPSRCRAWRVLEQSLTTAGRSSGCASWWAAVTEAARRPYQAPVSFRIAPRMLGQARRAATMAAEVAEESLQAVTDNPVWVDDVARGSSLRPVRLDRRLPQPSRGARHGRPDRRVRQSLRARRSARVRSCWTAPSRCFPISCWPPDSR